jgi:enoyl-CoA hydratase
VDALVTYEPSDSIATITMNDGRVNVMSLAMQAEIHRALDRAETDRGVVVLAGREGVFSAGFDLATLRSGTGEAVEMVLGGFQLAARVLSFPLPVVVACTGHAVAMGAFLLLSGDYRVGASGPFKLSANEVAIGLTMPYAATEILRQRLTPAAFNRAVTTAETFSAENALETGFLDQIVDPSAVLAVAQRIAHTMSTLDLTAHHASKLRARASALDALRAGIARDRTDLQTRLAMSG